MARAHFVKKEYQSRVYDITDMLNECTAGPDLESEVENIASEIRSLGEECEEKRSNMPDSLQDAPSGELLQERADACSSAADELEAIDFSDAPTTEDACPECDGDGEVDGECDDCVSGEAEEDCRACGGKGSIAVDGKDGEAQEQDCDECDAQGTVTKKCTSCDGEGNTKVECSECSGTGKLSEEKVEEWWQEKLEEVQNVSID